jgi:hypothetical protein
MLAPSPSSRPLALSDSEIAHIMAAARPLSPGDREAFLCQVAAVLELQPMLGPGIVSRVCRELQARYWRASEVDERPGKYGR